MSCIQGLLRCCPIKSLLSLIVMLCGKKKRHVPGNQVEAQYGELLCLLSSVFLCKDSKHFRIWQPTTSGKFFTKAFYAALERAPQPI